MQDVDWPSNEMLYPPAKIADVELIVIRCFSTELPCTTYRSCIKVPKAPTFVIPVKSSVSSITNGYVKSFGDNETTPANNVPQFEVQWVGDCVGQPLPAYCLNSMLPCLTHLRYTRRMWHAHVGQQYLDMMTGKK